VGTDWGSEKPDLTLKYSAEKNCSMPIDWTWMRAKSTDFWSGWKGQPDEPHPKWGWATPFTMFRYAIPELCGFKGRAIYLDTDMVVFGDLAELWTQKTRRPWFCSSYKRTDVSVIDCERFESEVAKTNWPSLEKLKGYLAVPAVVRLMLKQHDLIETGLEPQWNSCDRYDAGKTKLLHFTHMQSQPWHPWPDRFHYEGHKDPASVTAWRDMYAEALAATATEASP